MPLPARPLQVAYSALPGVDRWLLSRFAALMEEAAAGYEAFAFRRVLGAVLSFVSGELSATYLEIAKDRLYIQATHSASRRCS